MLAIVPRVVWALLWIVGLTWRYEVIAEDRRDAGVVRAEGRARKSTASGTSACCRARCISAESNAVILISRSFDGELITRMLRMFGFDAVRGSSSRSGREGLLGLKHVIESGAPAIFTADGPRGPDISDQDGAGQAGADDRRADRRISSAAGARVGA